MKLISHLFLMLFVSHISVATGDLQQEAFDVLAKSIRLKPNAMLDKNNFDPAINRLKNFLEQRYPELKTVQKQTQKSAPSLNFGSASSNIPETPPIIEIRQATAGEITSPEIQELLDNQYKTAEFTPQDFEKEYEFVINGYYCKAKTIPLVIAFGVYLHISKLFKLNNEIDKDILRFSNLLNDILSLNFLTEEHLNKLYQIQCTINENNIMIKATLAGVVFRFCSAEQVKDCLNKGGDPMVEGVYQGPNPRNLSTIVIERNKVGLSALVNTSQVPVIETILNHHNTKYDHSFKESFGYLIQKNKDGLYVLKPDQF